MYVLSVRWNLSYLFIYLLMRELAKRAVPKKLVPLFVLPTQFLGDFFGEQHEIQSLVHHE